MTPLSSVYMGDITNLVVAYNTKMQMKANRVVETLTFMGPKNFYFYYNV